MYLRADRLKKCTSIMPWEIKKMVAYLVIAVSLNGELINLYMCLQNSTHQGKVPVRNSFQGRLINLNLTSRTADTMAY